MEAENSKQLTPKEAQEIAHIRQRLQSLDELDIFSFFYEGKTQKITNFKGFVKIIKEKIDLFERILDTVDPTRLDH